MKDKISLVIHFPDGRSPKIISFKIRHLKIFFLSLLCLFFLSLISYFLNAVFLHKYSGLREKENRLEEAIIVNEKYKENLKQLKRNFEKLENYLRQRGIIKKDKKEMGGIAKLKAEKLSEEEYLDFLIARSEELFFQLKGIPMGFPVKGNVVSTMGWRKNPFGKGYEYHSGIDIEAPKGEPVYTTADGVVVWAGWYADYGKAVIIRHPSEYETLYGHLSDIKVKKGDKVKAGEIIGYVGSTGRSTGPHLHYEVIFEDKPIDPLRFMVWE